MRAIRQFFTQPYLYILISLIGISAKFYHLDHKLFWLDEVYTIQHVSGIPDKEYSHLVPADEVKNINFYKDLYRLNKQEYAIGTQLEGLLSSTQLNPLYYPFVMVWYRIVGDHPVDFRLFSVFIFILTLPFVFLLSRRLLGSSLAGWIAVSLFAVSPYMHLFAQEARYYIFWSLVVIALHCVFLQAIRHNKLAWWSAYSVLSALSLYASPVSIIVIFGHVAFLWLTRKDLLQRCGISVSAACIAYLPWALHLFPRLDAITSALSWQSNYQLFSFWMPLIGQGLFLTSIFAFRLDYLSAFEQSAPIAPTETLIALLFDICVLVTICVSMVALFTRTEKGVKYFLLSAILPGLVFFHGIDLLRNGMTSWWWRYLIFVAPGVILLMTSWLEREIQQGDLRYALCYLAVALIGIGSIGAIADARHWHLGDQMNVHIEHARMLSEAEKPLLITDHSNGRMADLVVVLQECRSDRIDVLRTSADIDELERRIRQDAYSDVFVLCASDELIRNLKSQFGQTMEKLDGEGTSALWKIRVEDD